MISIGFVHPGTLRHGGVVHKNCKTPDRMEVFVRGQVCPFCTAEFIKPVMCGEITCTEDVCPECNTHLSAPYPEEMA